MPRIFISYRRADSATITGRIHDRLARAFSEHSLFRDVYDIPAGSDFRAVLEKEVARCDTFLAIIGPRWAEITDSRGNRRLDKPGDFVRIEVEAALKNAKMRLIPVLVDGATMPKPEDLPESLRELCFRNAMQVRGDPDFPHDMQTLIRQLWLGVSARLLKFWPLLVVLLLILGIIFVPPIFLPPATPTPAISATTPPANITPLPGGIVLPLDQPLPVIYGFSIYDRADQDAAIIARARVGDTVTILSQSADSVWAEVSLSDDFTGWALTSDLATGLNLPTASPTSVVTPVVVGAGFGARTASWQLYFTNPGVTPDPQTGLGIDARLAEDIGRAKTSVDMATFEMDNELVLQALRDVNARGVRVRLIIDLENGQVDTTITDQLADSGIQIVDGGRSNGLMHNIFVVIDRTAVWTGSWAYTSTGTYNNNDNALVLTAPDIVSAYQVKFEQMFTQKEFGVHASRSTMNEFTAAGIPVEVYFTPGDNILPRIQELVGNAHESIRIMAFSFTDPDYTTLIVNGVSRGVPAWGIMETRGAVSSSQFVPLFCGGVDMRTDGNQYFMHHKVMIIDEQIVITGSMNFSRSGRQSNDENIVIIFDPRLAAVFNQEFDRLWAQAGKPTDITCK